MDILLSRWLCTPPSVCVCVCGREDKASTVITRPYKWSWKREMELYREEGIERQSEINTVGKEGRNGEGRKDGRVKRLRENEEIERSELKERETQISSSTERERDMGREAKRHQNISCCGKRGSPHQQPVK